MPDLDPYCRITTAVDSEFIQASRPITLTQDSADPGELNLPAGKDVVVFGDVVTIRGAIRLRRPAPEPTGDGPHPVAKGGSLLILARRLDTLPGKGGDAKLDLTGAEGETSAKIWTGPPIKEGKRGDPGRGATWSWESEKSGATGESSADASGKVNPKSRLHGQPGAPGGAGGNGGSLDLRCGSLATTVALAVDVSGGRGGTGQDGQPGAKGGRGGPGDEGGWVRSASGGGNGGRGGDGGDGGAPGPGGAPGTISITLRAGSTSALTCTLDAGAPGRPGWGGEPGAGGDPGLKGYWKYPDGRPGHAGDQGSRGPELVRGAANKAAISTPCDGSALLAHLAQPLSPYLAMMLDQMRADYLKATGSASVSALGELPDRLDWVIALANAYVPLDENEQRALDAVRGRIQTLQQSLKKGFDYFGHSASYAPLGALSGYRHEFDNALKTLRGLRSKYEANLKALQAATLSTDELVHAATALKEDQRAYTEGAEAERKTISDLIHRINDHDSDAVTAKNELLAKSAVAFAEAVQSACGVSVKDLVEVLGQMAFLGHEQPQKMAMYTSQAMKLLDSAASKCVTDTGVQIDKRLVIEKLGTVTDLSASLESYSGTIDGIKLSDPGAVKLLGKQSDLDQLCLQFWSYKGASEFKHALDDYVSAVQARNADIMALNESLARLRGYLAGAAQCDASIVEASGKEGKLAAPGAPALITQLARMVARATDDCIYWLYRVSRAYWMWALQPHDELAAQLREIGGADPLALTPETLASAAEGMSTAYATLFEKQLSNAGAWIPRPAHDGAWYPKPGERGICVEFTHATHPRFIERLRAGKHATVGIQPPRRATQTDAASPEHVFSGYADVRITKVRPWVFGARLKNPAPAKRTIRVDLTHAGHDTFVSPEDALTIVHHDAVHLMFEYAVDKPNHVGAIETDGELFDTATHTPGAMIGPFTRWRVTIPKPYNDQSLDTSGIDKVVFEFFLHQRPYPAEAHAGRVQVSEPRTGRPGRRGSVSI
jgi:hypothetical protein